MKIEKDKVVTIDYTLTDDHGTVLDSSKGHQPLAYLHGNGNLIPALEHSLEGKSVGNHIDVAIAPADAYGEWEQERVKEIPRSQFSGVEEIEVGMQFSARGNEGEHTVTVTKVSPDIITVDANHPLAGKTLHFDVTVVDVRHATDDELAHRHVHGPGGHH